MSKSIKEIIEEARQKTDQQLAGEITSHTNLTEEEINKIAPAKLDKENLAKLIDIVKDATKSNEEKAQAVKSVDQFVSLLISIAGKVL
ncbi:MAG: hypothetical protein NTX22_06140 [Ignavibacteriales bacterium]|nr:hypothetical protein [Ignavibacteriales bacterium]